MSDYVNAINVITCNMPKSAYQNNNTVTTVLFLILLVEMASDPEHQYQEYRAELTLDESLANTALRGGVMLQVRLVVHLHSRAGFR